MNYGLIKKYMESSRCEIEKDINRLSKKLDQRAQEIRNNRLKQ